MLTEFYSCAQKLRELEEVFADELQLLARKVISKKARISDRISMLPLSSTMQTNLYNRNSASIVKILLLQMPKVTCSLSFIMSL